MRLSLYEMVKQGASRPFGERGFHDNETNRSKKVSKAQKTNKGKFTGGYKGDKPKKK